MIRPLALFAVTGAVALLGAPPAVAVSPPEVDPAASPPSGSAGPVQPMAQRGECVVGGVLPGSDPGAVNPNQVALNLSGAWRHSRGEGQTVAVIDTGVTPGRGCRTSIRAGISSAPPTASPTATATAHSSPA